MAFNNYFYTSPSLELLRAPASRDDREAEDLQRAQTLRAAFDLMDFSAEVKAIVHGPQATLFAIQFVDLSNVNKLTTKQDQIAAVMGVEKIRIVLPIPGTALVGIEVPNVQREPVTLKELLADAVYRSAPSPTCVCIGKNIQNQPVYCEISDLPHVLIGGKSGSGKSTFLHSTILNLLFRAGPDQVRLLLIDPTGGDLTIYQGLPHLAAPVIADAQKGIVALAWVVKEMRRRYQLFQKAIVRNISGYNRKIRDPEKALPYLVVIVKELGLLISADQSRTEAAIQHLAALSRAAGIHLIFATEHLGAYAITEAVKANVPSRIGLAVDNKMESRVVLDMPGAETLLGAGDMLYFPRSEFRPIRVQGCSVSKEEVAQVVQDVKAQNAARLYLLPEEAFPSSEDIDRTLGFLQKTQND